MKDYLGSYEPTKKLYKVDLDEIYLHKHVYIDDNRQQEGLIKKKEELSEIGYTHDEIDKMMSKKLKKLVVLQSFVPEINIYRNDEILHDFKIRIPPLDEENLINYLNEYLGKNYELKNTYYTKNNDNKIYHIPNDAQRNNIYHKLRKSDFNLIHLEVK